MSGKRIESPIFELDTHELAWAAGFYDGEGSSAFQGSGSGYLRMRISQRGREVLDRFRRALGGMGVVHLTPANVRRYGNDYYMFELWRIEDVYMATWLLWRWLSVPKRVQLDVAFGRYHQNRKG